MVYQNMVVNPGNGSGIGLSKKIDVINAKPGNNVIIQLEHPIGKAEITVKDCRGRAVRGETRNLTAGAHVFDVPPSGLLEIRSLPN